MRRLILCLTLLMVVSTIPMAMADDDHNRSHRVRTHLSGFNEVHFRGDTTVTPIVPPAIRGAISTTASGKFVANDRRTRPKNPLHAELQKPGRHCYTRAHSLWSAAHGWRHRGLALRGTAGPPGVPAPPAVAAATPECPEEGTVEGTIEPAQVLAQTAQGFAAGDFDELVRAILAGAAYANVHSSVFGAGEIRGHFPGSHDD